MNPQYLFLNGLMRPVPLQTPVPIHQVPGNFGNGMPLQLLQGQRIIPQGPPVTFDPNLHSNLPVVPGPVQSQPQGLFISKSDFSPLIIELRQIIERLAALETK